jgi:hypothetical protein
METGTSFAETVAKPARQRGERLCVHAGLGRRPAPDRLFASLPRGAAPESWVVLDIQRLAM